MNRRDQLTGTFRLTALFTLVVAVSAMVAVVAEELFANRLFGLSRAPMISVLLAGIFAVAGVMLLLNFLYPKIGKLVSASAEVVPLADLKGRKYLITGYSPIYNLKEKMEGPFPDLARVKKLTIDDLCQGDHFLLLRSWQQNIRAISVLMDKGGLEQVFVISPDLNQFTHFKATMQAAIPNCPEITLVNDPDDPNAPFCPFNLSIHYESFEYVYAAIRRAMKMIMRGNRGGAEGLDSKIAIDITPGQKPYSMAAAIATLNSEMLAVYVASHSGKKTDQAFALLPYDAAIKVGEAPI